MSKRLYLVPTEQASSTFGKSRDESGPKELGIPLPAWNDAAAVASYLTTAVFTVAALLTLIHPGFTVPPVVDAVVTPVASIIAGVAQIINILTHRAAMKDAGTALATGRVRVVSAGGR